MKMGFEVPGFLLYDLLMELGITAYTRPRLIAVMGSSVEYTNGLRCSRSTWFVYHDVVRGWLNTPHHKKKK